MEYIKARVVTQKYPSPDKIEIEIVQLPGYVPRVGEYLKIIVQRKKVVNYEVLSITTDLTHVFPLEILVRKTNY